MALIKTAKSPHLIKDAVVLDIGDLGRQAERMLARAREEAQKIVADARAEERKLVDGADKRGHDEGTARGLAEGRDQGLRIGREQALAEAADQVSQLMEKWQRSLTEWESQREALLNGAREDVLVFAFELARKVVHRVLKSDSTVVKDQVAAALAVLARPGAVAIHVHPSDRPLLDEVLPDIVKTISGCEHAYLNDDETVERGGCVIHTQRGRIDATIATQLDRIADAILPDAPASSPKDAPAAPTS